MFYTVHGTVKQIDRTGGHEVGKVSVWFLTEGRNMSEVRNRGGELLRDYCERENGMMMSACDFRMEPGGITVERMIGATVRDGAVIMVRTEEQPAAAEKITAQPIGKELKGRIA